MRVIVMAATAALALNVATSSYAQETSSEDNKYVKQIYASLKFIEVPRLGIHIAHSPYRGGRPILGKIATDSPLIDSEYESGDRLSTIEFYFGQNRDDRATCNTVECIVKEATDISNIKVGGYNIDLQRIELPPAGAKGLYVWRGPVKDNYELPIEISEGIYSTHPLTCQTYYHLYFHPDSFDKRQEFKRALKNGTTHRYIQKLETVLESLCGKLNKGTSVGLRGVGADIKYFVVNSRNAVGREECELGLARVPVRNIIKFHESSKIPPGAITDSYENHTRFVNYIRKLGSSCDFEKPQVVQAENSLDQGALRYPVSRNGQHDYLSSLTWYVVAPSRILAFDVVETGATVKFDWARDLSRSYSSKRRYSTGNLDLQTMTFTVIDKFPDLGCWSKTLREKTYKLKPVLEVSDLPEPEEPSHTSNPLDWSDLPRQPAYVSWVPDNAPQCALSLVRGCNVDACVGIEAIKPIFTTDRKVAEAIALKMKSLNSVIRIESDSESVSFNPMDYYNEEWERQRQIDINELTVDLLNGVYR